MIPLSRLPAARAGRAVLGALLVVSVLAASVDARVTPAAARVARAAARVTYRLEHRPGRGDAPPTWLVAVRASGLRARELPLRLVFPSWGAGAVDADALRVVPDGAGRASVDGDGLTIRVEPSEPGATELTVAFPVRLPAVDSEERRANGLLPASFEGGAYGFSWNVLPEVLAADGPLPGRRAVRLVPPEGGVVASGWGGLARGEQVVELPTGVSMENASLAFGEPASSVVGEIGGVRVEVFQYGDGPDGVDVVAGVLARAEPFLREALGDVGSRRPVRAFVTHTGGGGMATHADLRVGLRADDPPEVVASPWFAQLVVHELTHHWLGLAAREADASLVWFKEGFTDYLALWAAASTGLVSRGWFAERLLELEGIARALPSDATTAFGDPTVTWRDGDGANEHLAYAGGPLLALAFDVELRRSGRAGLPMLVRALASRDEPYTLDDLEHWAARKGLRPLWRRAVVGTERPPVAELLARAGFETVEQPVDLAYVGLALEEGTLPARVTAVDPDGPLAGHDVRPGDLVTGWWPARPDPVEVDGVRRRAATWPFGLHEMLPGYDGSYLGVRRGEVDRQVFFTPTRLQGAGVVRGVGADGDGLDEFFDERR